MRYFIILQLLFQRCSQSKNVITLMSIHRPVVESWNHRIIWVGKYPWDHQVQLLTPHCRAITPRPVPNPTLKLPSTLFLQSPDLGVSQEQQGKPLPPGWAWGLAPRQCPDLVAAGHIPGMGTRLPGGSQTRWLPQAVRSAGAQLRDTVPSSHSTGRGGRSHRPPAQSTAVRRQQ